MHVTTEQNPIKLFKDWLADANQSELNDPNAMNLATVSKVGVPSSRMVLLKDVTHKGFTFYTNLTSKKARDIRENPNVALCFHWKSLKRQVRIEGIAESVDTEEANAYFATRNRNSRVGAWASKQSQILLKKSDLEKRVIEFKVKFEDSDVPRPEFWSGFRVVPEVIEFWKDQPFRLHDRSVYRRSGNGWTMDSLYP